MGWHQRQSQMWGQAMEADHLAHATANMATRGMAPTGSEMADELLELITLHDTSTLLLLLLNLFWLGWRYRLRYLQRLRAICDQHDILLIFDEVITGFGRTGDYFGAQTLASLPT